MLDIWLQWGERNGQELNIWGKLFLIRDSLNVCGKAYMAEAMGKCILCKVVSLIIIIHCLYVQLYIELAIHLCAHGACVPMDFLATYFLGRWVLLTEWVQMTH